MNDFVLNKFHMSMVKQDLPQLKGDTAFTHGNRRQADFWVGPYKSGKICCRLCPRRCLIAEGEKGWCQTRLNRGGVLYAQNYGWLRALNLEAMENIPMADFYPGMGILTVGSYGCNLACPGCVSHQLINNTGSGRALYPAELAEIADQLKARDNIGLAFSYTEPVVAYEYMLDSFIEAKKYDLKTLVSTNGMIEEAPLAALLPYLDAVNLDIKSLRPEFYQELGGDLQCVLDRAVQIKEAGVHLEVCTMHLPGSTIPEVDISALAIFIAKRLGKQTPFHIMAYRPNSHLDLLASEEEDLVRAADEADRYLDNVYMDTPYI
jgi:pyruvate formate lyase activating enzyme